MDIRNKKVAYITLGCKLNFSETSTIKHSLEEAGCESIDEKAGADIFVINTCSVTDIAEKKGRQIIRKIIRRNPNAYVVIVGCYAQLRAKELMEIEGVSLVLGANEKFKVTNYLKHLEEREQQEPHSCDVFKIKDFDLAYSFGDRTRCFLKIQDGCDYFCSYCTIPFARGKSRSATIEQVIESAKDIAQKGIKEIILAGVNTGDFGRGNNQNFLELIKELDKIEGIERYRISSIEPNLLTEEIIQFVAQSNKFMPHFHIPLQAGSNEVLTLMKRRYTTELFEERVNCIKRIIPHAFIGVDIIAGMRGETNEYFQKGVEFVSKLNISRLHVFPYSERAGTVALSIEPSISPNEKNKRVETLLQISNEKLHKFCNEYLNSSRPVLFEESRSRKYVHGYTDNYIKVELPYDSTLVNKVFEIELNENNVSIED